MITELNCSIDPDNPADLITFGLCDPLTDRVDPFSVAGILQARPEAIGEIRAALEALNDAHADNYGAIYCPFSLMTLPARLLDSLITDESPCRLLQIATWIAKHRREDWKRLRDQPST